MIWLEIINRIIYIRLEINRFVIRNRFVFTFLWRKVQVETERYLSGVTRLYSFLLQHPPFLIPQPATTFSSSIAFSSSFTSSWSSIVPLLPLLCFSLLLNPSSILPVPTSLACRLHAHMQRARPAGWHSVAFSAVHLRVSQSVSQSLSQSVGESDRHARGDIVCRNYVHSLFSPFSFFPPFSFSRSVLSHSILRNLFASFGRVECWPRASLFAARVLLNAEKNVRLSRALCLRFVRSSLLLISRKFEARHAAYV